MKKLLIAALITAASFTANAEMASCDNIAGLARKVMEGRQRGVSIRDMMNVSKNNRLLKLMVIDAYKTSAFSTPKYRTKAANEFEGKWYLICEEKLK